MNKSNHEPEMDRNVHETDRRVYAHPMMEVMLLTSSQEILLTNNSIENPTEDKEEWTW